MKEKSAGNGGVGGDGIADRGEPPDPGGLPDPGGPRAAEGAAAGDRPAVLDNFVVIEGLDGAGTTTLLQRLEQELSGRSIPHWCTFEPTDGWIGRRIRSILRGEESVHPRTMALLYAADRSEHLHAPGGGILARLERGELVVCDRYLFSSLAYQGVLVEFDYVAALNSRFPLPRHLVFLDTPVELSQKRLAGRGRAELYEAAELQRRVLQEGYARVFERYRDSAMRLHRVDGSGAPQEIFRRVWKILRAMPIVKG